jgi:hypothetical protein
MATRQHYWSYCSHCRRRVVICGKCGNNCCNGGYGEIPSPEPETMMQCDVCPSAYDMQDAGEKRPQSHSL